jgi:hypothetical protein
MRSTVICMYSCTSTPLQVHLHSHLNWFGIGTVERHAPDRTRQRL